jgi:hypothetical protein
MFALVRKSIVFIDSGFHIVVSPYPKEKIPPEGYLRVPGTLREWLQFLRVKDIEVAIKQVRRTGPFNQWKETAWHLWRKGEI